MLLDNKRIAVIEDDITNMAIISTLLKRHGAAVFQDPWNTDTVERLRAVLPIDVILLDLMLRRGVSGFDIFDKIKAAPDLVHIPVVLVTASDPALEMNKARDKGFMGYIEKPIDYQDFPKQLQLVLLGTPVWAE
jgi:CheY-like chemotaxis protein